MQDSSVATTDAADTVLPRWQVLGARDRRVAGVLVEKAKTTPSAYPMTLNAIKNACNQKSNRSPMMQLDEDAVEESLDSLRAVGAVVQVQGDSRVAKYRHRLYEWLGVDKVELAVMAELLLRGAQTVGELRARAARMEPIADLAALKPILASLGSKGLLLTLTPEGRGCIVTHALLDENELAKVRRNIGAATTHAATVPEDTSHLPVGTHEVAPSVVEAERSRAHAMSPDVSQELREEIQAMREEMTSVLDALRRDLEDVRSQLGI